MAPESVAGCSMPGMLVTPRQPFAAGPLLGYSFFVSGDSRVPLEVAAGTAVEAAQGRDRRIQILEATARVISERGADGTRLVDVARRVGVSIGLIQHYFLSRDDLLTEAFVYINEFWVHQWEKAASSEADPPRKLMILLRYGAFEFEDWREVQWRIWVEFWSLCNRDERFRRQYTGIYERFRQPFRAAIEEGVAAGYFTTESVDDAVDRLTAQLDGLRIHALLEPERMPREHMFELLVRAAEQELGFSLPAC
jgi:AcrR family transcriptional regulator